MSETNIWKGRLEEDIQDCLEEAYQKQDYQITNIHKIDRSHENGVDLEIRKPDELIHIQTKIKPLKKDIEQLSKLASSPAQKKIYVYVEEPAVNFKEEMERVKDKVDFWDETKLNIYLTEKGSTTYFRYLFLSTTLVRQVIDIFTDILECERVASKNIEKMELLDWWLFKDRAVKLNGCLEHVKSTYTKEFLSKDRIEEQQVKNYLEQILLQLDIINTNAGLDLCMIVKTIKTKYPFLLSSYVEKITLRSNFIGMPHKKEGSEQSNFRINIENWILPSLPADASFYDLAIVYLKRLNEIAESIEDGVDWVFEDYFKSSS